MHSRVIYDLDTGRILMRCAGENAAAAFQPEFGQGALDLDPPRLVDFDAHHVDAGAVLDRPRVAFPRAVAAGEPIGLDHVPAGASITVTNEVGDSVTLTAFDEALTLLDAGLYRVRIEAPFPWQTEALEVLVDA